MVSFDVNEDYYQILKVGRRATVDEIIKSWKKLSSVNHPDKYNEENSELSVVEMTELSQKINNAKTVLTDIDLRKRYDQERKWPQEIVRAELLLSLTELYWGRTKLYKAREGTVLKVVIPAGCPTPRVFVFTPEEHHVDSRYEITVLEEWQEQFTRVGVDLRYDVEITLVEAMNGVTLEIPTLKNDITVKVEIVGEDVVGWSTKLIPKSGYGFPHFGQPDLKGELLINVKVGIFLLE